MGCTSKVLLSFLGMGYLPVAPGTWGSAGAAILYVAAVWAGVPAFPLCIGAAALFAALTITLGARAEQHYGRKDPPQVVTDEVAGYFLSAALLIEVHPLAVAVCAFILFRFFDILKPFPIRRIEKLPAGWGVALDDLTAGIFACACAHAVFLLILPGCITG